MSTSNSSNIFKFINYRMQVALIDGRQIIGKFLAFDRHNNLVLGDSEEFQKLPPVEGNKKKNEEREEHRTVGLVLIRGAGWISMSVAGPPPPEESRAKSGSATAVSGRWIGPAAGRGVPNVPLVQDQPGLSGPVRGIGPQQIIRPPGQLPSRVPPAFAGQGGPPPPQYGRKRKMMEPPPGGMMSGPRPPPSQHGMSPPPGGAPIFGPPSGGLPRPPPPNHNNQQH